MERLEDRTAGTRILRAGGNRARFSAWLPSSAFLHPNVCQSCSQLGGNLCFRSRSRRTFLSRLGAEPFGAAAWTHPCSDHCFNSLWPVPFQKKIGALQLEICAAGDDCRDFLWTGVARSTTRPGFRDHAHLCGLALVVVVLETALRGGAGTDGSKFATTRLRKPRRKHEHPWAAEGSAPRPCLSDPCCVCAANSSDACVRRGRASKRTDRHVPGRWPRSRRHGRGG